MRKLSRPTQLIILIALIALFIGIILAVLHFLGVTEIFTSSLKHQEMCSDPKVEIGEISTGVESDEPNAFVYPSNFSAEPPEINNSIIYTNSKTIRIFIPVTRAQGIDSSEITNIITQTKSGAVESAKAQSISGIKEKSMVGGVRIGELGMICGGCGCVSNSGVSIVYHLTEDMLQNNIQDTLSIDFKAAQQQIKRSFTIQSALWTKLSFSEDVNKVGDKGEYWTETGKEVTYTVELKLASGGPLTGQQVGLTEVTEGYITPQIISPFAEVSPGVYQTRFTSFNAGKVDTRVIIVNQTPNPQYNMFVINFSDMRIVEQIKVDQNAFFSFNPNYRDADNNRFFYARINKKVPKENGGYDLVQYLQRINFRDFNGASINRDDMEGLSLRKFVVDPSGQKVAFLEWLEAVNRRYIKFYNLTENGELKYISSLDFQDYIDRFTDLRYSDDGGRLVVKSDGVNLFNTTTPDFINKVSVETPDNSSLLWGSFLSDRIIFIKKQYYINDLSTLYSVDTVKGALITKKDIFRNKQYLIDITSSEYEKGAIIYMVYRNSNRKVIKSGDCERSRQEEPNKVLFEVYNPLTLEKIEDFILNFDLEGFNEFKPMHLLYDSGKLILIGKMEYNKLDCKSKMPSRDKAFVIDLQTKTVVYNKTLPTDLGEFYVGGGYLLQIYPIEQTSDHKKLNNINKYLLEY